MDAIENTTNQKKKAMTKDEIIMQLMDLLKENQMNQQANGVYEICSYVDGLQNKLDSMTEELSSMRKQIEEMQQDTVLNNLKKSLHEAADRLENRCNIIKGELFTVKATIHQKASDIVAETKKKGRVALNRVSEIFGIKDKLTKMKGNIEQGILDTDKTIAKIEAFGTGMRKANEQIVNTFRTFADKPEVDYATKEQKFSKTELAKKPWKWKRKCISQWWHIWMVQSASVRNYQNGWNLTEPTGCQEKKSRRCHRRILPSVRESYQYRISSQW